MHINFVAYNYSSYDGYGRFATQLYKALCRIGVQSIPFTLEQLRLPRDIITAQGFVPTALTISILPPYSAMRTYGPQWLFTMTEGDQVPPKWDEYVHATNIQKLLVPSRYCLETFSTGVTHLETLMIPGGVDANEFPILPMRTTGPCRFLVLGDRGTRKGWVEAWEAFHAEFALHEPVELIVKARPGKNELIDSISQGQHAPNVKFWLRDDASFLDTLRDIDAVVLPSRSEGFGMPHREASLAGRPCITLQYSGLDDGNTSKWSFPITQYRVESIPKKLKDVAGNWARADISELRKLMRSMYENYEAYYKETISHSYWLRKNCTWEESASELVDRINHGTYI